ncbi:MAG TPA: SDR family oxidoreductase [Myxococcota bacterium]|nr:SDR family oxidoreductase [Myxococcota bacterium]
MNRLSGKVALITGAARGLGLAIAKRFVEEGASVVVNDVDPVAAEKSASPLGGLGIGADVSDSAAVRRMFATVADHFGRLDILVNNAGISGVENDPDLRAKFRDKQLAQAAELAAGGPIRTHLDAAVEVTDEAWHRMLAVHLDGTFFCSREALKLMNSQMSGTIINMGSIMGTAGGAGAVAYCAAKAGILGFTRALAREVVTRNIRVNAIAPGWIDTDMTAFLEQLRTVIEMSTPMHRLGDPDDIAWAAVYLASDEAKFVTGQVLSPNGGWHMSQ